MNYLITYTAFHQHFSSDVIYKINDWAAVYLRTACDSVVPRPHDQLKNTDVTSLPKCWRNALLYCDF